MGGFFPKEYAMKKCLIAALLLCLLLTACAREEGTPTEGKVPTLTDIPSETTGVPGDGLIRDTQPPERMDPAVGQAGYSLLENDHSIRNASGDILVKIQYDQVILVVPMYGGNPSSLYFAFCERGQDFFRSEESWKDVLRRLYIIGVYGSAEESPDFIPTLEKWFTGTEYTGRVLGLERHVYGQTMTDSLLDAGEVRDKINEFLQ